MIQIGLIFFGQYCKTLRKKYPIYLELSYILVRLIEALIGIKCLYKIAIKENITKAKLYF